MLTGNSVDFTRRVPTFSSQVKPWPGIRGNLTTGASSSDIGKDRRERWEIAVRD